MLFKGLSSRFLFCSKQVKAINANGQLDGTLEDILAQRKKVRSAIYRQEMDNLPAQQNVRNFYDSLVNINLYMKQDCWKSQYLYLLLNYNQLGFRRISDLVMLDRASYLLDLRNVQEEERWPAIKVVIALEPKIILSGVSPISQFFRQNAYFLKQIDRHSSEIESLENHLNKQAIPYLQSLFWHPMLTYQYSFHTNMSSYIDTSRSNNIYGILSRNGSVIASRVIKNLINIAKDSERYRTSKQKFTKSIKQLQSIYLSKKQYFGGDIPNHIDFYLMAQLRTKSGSSLFMKFLQNQIGGNFWRWWIRMSNACQYNPDRITTL